MATARHAKVSVTLPAELLDRVRTRVGARGLSAFVARAVEAEERVAELRSWLDGAEQQHGPIPAEVLDQVRREWHDAGLVGS